MEWAEKLPLDGGRVPGERQGERQLAKSRCSFRMRASAWFRYVYPSPKTVCVYLCVCVRLFELSGQASDRAGSQAAHGQNKRQKGSKLCNNFEKTWQLQWSAKYLNKLLS